MGWFVLIVWRGLWRTHIHTVNHSAWFWESNPDLWGDNANHWYNVATQHLNYRTTTQHLSLDKHTWSTNGHDSLPSHWDVTEQAWPVIYYSGFNLQSLKCSLSELDSRCASITAASQILSSSITNHQTSTSTHLVTTVMGWMKPYGGNCVIRSSVVMSLGCKDDHNSTMCYNQPIFHLLILYSSLTPSYFSPPVTSSAGSQAKFSLYSLSSHVFLLHLTTKYDSVWSFWTHQLGFYRQPLNKASYRNEQQHKKPLFLVLPSFPFLFSACPVNLLLIQASQSMLSSAGAREQPGLT